MPTPEGVRGDENIITMAHVQFHHEVPTTRTIGSWQLCFQQCTFYYDNGTTDNGYRFIWRRPNGRLQPARGQARIPSKQDLEDLLNQAAQEGWYK